MTLFDIFKNIHVEADKDVLDGWLSPKEFNYLLETCNHSFFNRKMDDLFLKQGQVNKNLLSMKFLRPLMIRETIVPTSGVIDLTPTTGDLSNEFAYWWSAYTTAVYQGQKRKIELVDGAEADDRIHNRLSKPILYNPIAVIDEDNLRLYPKNITSVQLTYIKVPATPVFDYYVDANHQIQYLAASGSRLLTAGEYGSAGQTSGTTVSSSTVELSYDSIFHDDFANELRGRLGLRLRDQLVMQDAMTKVQKEDSI